MRAPRAPRQAAEFRARRNHETIEQIVLVTGGTSGIGLEAAKLFRAEGATVIIVEQNPARLQSTASQLGDSVTVLRGDVSKPAEVENIMKPISENSAVSMYRSRSFGSRHP